MMETIGNRVCSADTSELARWFDRADEPWNPITAAKRQFDALIGNTETVPALAAYDHLCDMANQAVRWIELNSCPDTEIGRRFSTLMMVYRIVAETLRFTLVAEGGDTMVAQLVGLRELMTNKPLPWGYDHQYQKASREEPGGRRAHQ